MITNKEFKKALIDANLTVAKLARILGYTREHTAGVICGTIKSERAKKLIAEALQKEPREIWDDEICSGP